MSAGADHLSPPGSADVEAARERAVEHGETDARLRQFSPPASTILTVLAAGISCFHIYANLIGIGSDQWLISLHFAGLALLCALRYPASRRQWSSSTPALLLDLAFGLLVFAATVFIIASETTIYRQGVHFSAEHWVAALIVIVGAIELARRTTGIIIPVIVILAVAYASPLGQHVPGVLRFAGLSTETIAFRSIFSDEGMFGMIGRISATYVFMFILFGAFLVRSGAGDFIISTARIAAGRFIGGPGYVAVLASGLTGTISGSAVANTVSTGVITIPLMKKSGFPPRFAAATEAAASTGGQLMPPIMGAGAFVMASNTQIPYLDIVAVSALPAIVYFLSVTFFVRITAKKENLVGVTMEEGSLIDALKAGGPSFLVPITVLIGLLVYGFTPVYAAGWAILTCIVASWLTPHRMGPRAIFDALAMGAQNMVMTGVLLITIGLLVNVISMTGIGNTFSLMIADWAGGSLLVSMILVAIASLVLGMGLPVTAAYIVLATLSAPALQALIQNGFLIDALVAGSLPEAAKAPFMLASPEAMELLAGPMSPADAAALVASTQTEVLALVYPLAIDPALITAALLSAHMIIFWLSQDSNVTPPVCLTAFAAAAIANTSHMRTGFTAWRLAKGLYLVPVLFAYTPFLYGTPLQVFTVFAVAVIGVYALGAAIEGHMEAPLTWPERAVTAVAGVALMWPETPLLEIAGAAVLMAIFAVNIRRDRARRRAGAA